MNHTARLLGRSTVAILATENAVALFLIAHEHPATQLWMLSLGGALLAVIAGAAAMSAASTASQIGIEAAWHSWQNRQLRERYPLLPPSPMNPAQASLPDEYTANNPELPDPADVARDAALIDGWRAGRHPGRAEHRRWPDPDDRARAAA